MSINGKKEATSLLPAINTVTSWHNVQTEAVASLAKRMSTGGSVSVRWEIRDHYCPRETLLCLPKCLEFGVYALS